jgi:UDP-N-acetylglucosamine:LPS N-acetylglucosamine transferase
LIPPPAAEAGEADGEVPGLLAIGGAAGAQAFSKILPVAADPKIRNSRRLNRLAIKLIAPQEKNRQTKPKLHKLSINSEILKLGFEQQLYSRLRNSH